MEALTALQWVKEGHVPNADAVGEERWTNCFHGQKTLKLQRTCLELNKKNTKKHQIKGTKSEKKTWLIERT